MKKLTALILSSMLATAFSSAMAQNVTAAGPAIDMTPAAPRTTPPIKDFKAARDLELDRAKFNGAAMDKMQKCIVAAKTAADLDSCQATYRATVMAHVATLKAQGKFAAAYGVADTKDSAPTAPAKK